MSQASQAHLKKKGRKMQKFDKQMAIDVIEDALTCIDTPHECGVAVGLCGGFYMSCLISKQEWMAFLRRIPVGLYVPDSEEISAPDNVRQGITGRLLN